jgi:two-component system OmpR family response regulator
VIRILLVEDDPNMLDLIGYVLRRERFVVVEATDGAQALRRWKADRPDLVVVDLGLPTLDGFEVIRRIREEDDTPVLVVTGRRQAQDVLRSFSLGTDDLLAKPFEFGELVARIRAILRRARSGPLETTEPRLQLEDMSLDPEVNEVTWRGETMRLTPIEFRILYVLAKNAGHVVPASRLYTYVWGSDGGDANALRSHISHLRRKLDIRGETPATISSVPAVGYILRTAVVTPARMSLAAREAGPSPA